MSMAVLLYATYLPACATAAPAQAPADTSIAAAGTSSAAEDSARVAELIANTQPGAPLQIMFDWSLEDRDVKVAGKGIVRMESGYRARLDLFGPRDVQLLRAALIGDSLALAYDGPQVPLPPVEFLWSVLGVFRAPAAATTRTVKDEDGGLTIRYEGGADHWRFHAEDATLRNAEWTGSDGGRRTVELSGPFHSARPTKAMYRDWRAFRQLTLTATRFENVDSFAPETWNVSNR
jgi:hypothetical protein